MRSSSAAAATPLPFTPPKPALTRAVAAAVLGAIERLRAAGVDDNDTVVTALAVAAIGAVAAHIADRPADAMDVRVQQALIASARQPSRFDPGHAAGVRPAVPLDPDQRGSWNVREHRDGSVEFVDFKPKGPGLMSTKVDP